MAHPVWPTDDDHKLVNSRLGDRLHVAGAAELNGHDRAIARLTPEMLRAHGRD